MLLGMLVLSMCVARFLFLEGIPVGFWMDESAGATHVMCLQEDGRDFHGESWPLFSKVVGKGEETPVLLYFGYVWSRVFGTSPGAWRAISAFFTVLTIGGIFAFVHRWLGWRPALWSAVAAAISPWSFQFSRVAWDPPLAPFFLVWGLFCVLCARGVSSAVAGGVLLALAGYSYPPMRLQIPLIFAGLACVRGWLPAFAWKRVSVVVGSAVLAGLPLIEMTLSGKLQSRFQDIGIFSDHAGSATAGEEVAARLPQFRNNLWLHLQPGYLLGEGDANLRHSTGMTGIMSWLDGLVIYGFLFLLLASRWRRELRSPMLRERETRGIVFLCLIGFFAGIVPSALTWESLPHALRTLGAWPFLSILTGVLASVIISVWPRFVAVGVLSTVLFSAVYLKVFFVHYPAQSRQAFQYWALDSARVGQRTGVWTSFAQVTRRDPRVSIACYEMQFRGLSCRQARAVNP